MLPGRSNYYGPEYRGAQHIGHETKFYDISCAMHETVSAAQRDECPGSYEVHIIDLGRCDQVQAQRIEQYRQFKQVSKIVGRPTHLFGH